MCGLDIACPRCKNGMLENDRTNFSKNKILFPVFCIDGPPLWCMIQSMTCPRCHYREDSNDGEIICSLPAYARNVYPVEAKYCFDHKHSHLARSATSVFDLLMTTYGNGDLCSQLLYNTINRSYLERVENYYSFHKKMHRKEKNQWFLIWKKMGLTLLPIHHKKMAYKMRMIFHAVRTRLGK